MSDIWFPLRTLIQRHSDEARPLRLATVTSTDLWAPTGASFIQVLIGGANRLAIYRDGPEPAIGAPVQVIQMAPGATGQWLALPLPQGGCAGMVYASLRLLDGTGLGDFIVARFDTLLGSWEFRSAHPGGGTETRRPIRGWPGGDTLLTWAVPDDGSAPGRLWRSTDFGLTWDDTGLDVLDVAQHTSSGEGYAVTATAIRRTTDYGATWAPFAGGALGGGTWRTISWWPDAPVTIVMVATSGLEIFMVDPTAPGFPPPAPYGAFGPTPTIPFPPVDAGPSVARWRPGTAENWSLALGALGGNPGQVLAGHTMTQNIAFQSGSPDTYPTSAANVVTGDATTSHGMAGNNYGGAGGGEGGFDDAGHTLYDDDGTDHPLGLSGFGVWAASQQFATDGPPYYSPSQDCLYLGLQDETVGTPKFLIRDNEDGTVTFLAGDGNMTTVLGGTYIASPEGLTNMDVDSRFR